MSVMQNQQQNENQQPSDEDYMRELKQWLKTAQKSKMHNSETIQWLKQRAKSKNNNINKSYLLAPHEMKREMKIRKIFSIFDEDKSGALDLNEMVEMFHKFNINVDKNKLSQMYQIVDNNNDKALNYFEFKNCTVNQQANKIFAEIIEEVSEQQLQKQPSERNVFLPRTFSGMVAYLSYLISREQKMEVCGDNEKKYNVSDKMENFIKLIQLNDFSESGNQYKDKDKTDGDNQKNLNLDQNDKFQKQNSQEQMMSPKSQLTKEQFRKKKISNNIVLNKEIKNVGSQTKSQILMTQPDNINNFQDCSIKNVDNNDDQEDILKVNEEIKLILKNAKKCGRSQAEKLYYRLNNSQEFSKTLHRTQNMNCDDPYNVFTQRQNDSQQNSKSFFKRNKTLTNGFLQKQEQQINQTQSQYYKTQTKKNSAETNIFINNINNSQQFSNNNQQSLLKKKMSNTFFQNQNSNNTQDVRKSSLISNFFNKNTPKEKQLYKNIYKELQQNIEELEKKHIVDDTKRIFLNKNPQQSKIQKLISESSGVIDKEIRQQLIEKNVQSQNEFKEKQQQQAIKDIKEQLFQQQNDPLPKSQFKRYQNYLQVNNVNKQSLQQQQQSAYSVVQQRENQMNYANQQQNTIQLKNLNNQHSIEFQKSITSRNKFDANQQYLFQTQTPRNHILLLENSKMVQLDTPSSRICKKIQFKKKIDFEREINIFLKKQNIK